MAIQKLDLPLEEFINNAQENKMLKKKHLALFKSGSYLRDAGSKKHFCVYFVGLDIKEKQFFLGHHKKANQWLFNGGHLDRGETLQTAVIREAIEEWGIVINLNQFLPFSKLSITDINNPQYQPHCEAHYDLWHFVSLQKKSFKPDKEKMLKEFHEWGWLSIAQAAEKVTDKNSLTTLSFIKKYIFLDNV